MLLKPKLYEIVTLLLLINLLPLFAQTWCPPMRVSPCVTDYYIVLGQGLTADLSGTPWCGWSAETTNPHAFNIYVSHYCDTTWSDPDTIYPFLIFFMYCDLATDANGNVWVVAEDDGISACFYNGSSWSNLMAVPTQGTCSHFPVATGDSFGNLWVCWAGGGPGDGHHIWGNAYISGQWDAPVLISYPGSHEEFTYSMTTDIQGNVWVGWYRSFCPDRGICVSFNDGSTWSDTMVIAEYSYSSLGPALTVDTSGKVWAGWLGCDSIDNWKVYASYYDGIVWSDPMLVSDESGVGDWPIAITSDNQGMVWLAWMNSNENIYYSYWNGNEWLDPAPIDTHPATDYNLKMAFDGERIWVTWIRWVEISGQDTFSVYASYTYGVGVEEKQTTNHLPSGSGLCQSYPNPFSKLTKISFGKGHGAKGIELKIYDVSGRLVRQWDYPTIRQSDHIIWYGEDDHGRAVAQGIYFIRVENLNTGETVCKKVLKVK